ncbi:MAG TPA: helix-turn-helix domain-containing protein [Fimbriimonadaceae bacterium]|nr:helix-turn-helix domain-containing protein [Fimbriimonadaceae bacterium]
MAKAVRMTEWSEEVGMPPLLRVASVRLGFVVEHYQHQFVELEQPPLTDDILGMTITRPVGIERKIGARGRHEVHDPGSLHIIASGSEGRWQFDTPLDSMHLRMTPAFLLRSFGEEGEGVRLADVDLALEPRASSLLATLLQKVRDESAVDLEAESMAVRIARLLLDHHGSGRAFKPSRRQGLAASELRTIDASLHARLGQPVSVAEIADEAMLSPFHLMRLFKLTTGETLYHHALALRIERAKELLRSTRLTVAEVGLETGFHDESHFVRHFRKHVHATPTQFRSAMSRIVQG